MPDNTDLPAGVPPAGNPPIMPGNPAPANAPVVPVVPVVATPTPTPAPAPKPADNPADTPKPADAPAELATLQTGNAALDAAIGIVVAATKATNADIDRLTKNAIEHGNLALIDEAFARERFGDKADQVLALAKAAVEQQLSARTAAIDEVYQAAGGKDRWDSAVFNANAPQHLKTAVTLLLDSGQHKEGAQLLLDTVVQAGLFVDANPTISGLAGKAGGGALDKNSFMQEMAKLKQEAGNRSLESGPFGERYQQLMERRAMGRRLGM